MNRSDAALRLAHRFPGGLEAVAHRMGKRADTLRKELTGVHGYKWGVDDEELLMDLCAASGVEEPLAPLTATAANRSFLLLPFITVEGAEEGESFKAMAEMARKFSEFIGSIAEAWADGRVTANELKRGEREAAGLVAGLQRLLARLRAAHESGKPRHFGGRAR